MKRIIFDCETGSLDEKFLSMIEPEFKPDSRLTDPVKIEASIAKKRQDWIDGAALDATTARVICIGVIDPEDKFICLDGGGSEKQLLQDWLEFVNLNKDSLMIGFCSNSFDVPMLCRRAWYHGIRPCVGPSWNPRRMERWIDLREVYLMGDRETKTGGLNGLARFFGLEGKLGDGKQFAELWKVSREDALLYLERDLQLTRQVAEKMFVI